jgi:hypothetical protein
MSPFDPKKVQAIPENGIFPKVKKEVKRQPEEY